MPHVRRRVGGGLWRHVLSRAIGAIVIASGPTSTMRETDALAMSEPEKAPMPQAPVPHSIRSAPPDTTPYARPAIPEDQAPCPNDGASSHVPCRRSDLPIPLVPSPGPGIEAAPRPGVGPAPAGPSFRRD